MELSLTALQSDPALMVAAAVIGMGLLGLVTEMVVSSFRRAGVARSPIVVTGDAPDAIGRMPAFAPRPEVQSVPPAEEVAPPPVAAPEPPKDVPAEHRRFFATLSAALNIDESAPAALAALHANLTSDVFMQRMTLATKAWRADGFATGARELAFVADGAPPDSVSSKVLEGYAQLRDGKVKDALDAFLSAIEAARSAADADGGSPWPHAWSAFAWRGLAIIAEEAGDVQATLAGLKVAYQSMINAYEIALHGSSPAIAGG